eukprot:5754705-Prorocentrum_lima.AAC.1
MKLCERHWHGVCGKPVLPSPPPPAQQCMCMTLCAPILLAPPHRVCLASSPSPRSSPIVPCKTQAAASSIAPVSYTHLRAHETRRHL